MTLCFSSLNGLRQYIQVSSYYPVCIIRIHGEYLREFLMQAKWVNKSGECLSTHVYPQFT